MLKLRVEKKKLTCLSVIAVLFVLILYVWFISIGPWRSRGYTSDYYSRLATSFQHGQLALEEKPDPALLALPNPYDHKARKNVPVVGDASLYEGKYYAKKFLHRARWLVERPEGRVASSFNRVMATGITRYASNDPSSSGLAENWAFFRFAGVNSSWFTITMPPSCRSGSRNGWPSRRRSCRPRRRLA